MNHLHSALIASTAVLALLGTPPYSVPTERENALNAPNIDRAADLPIILYTVTVNSFGEGDIVTPLGGYKQSGFGGRDNSIHAHDQSTQLKTIWLDLTDVAGGAID